MELASTDSRGGRVLLVEDDELNRNVLRSFLESLDYEVVTAATGSAALAAALGSTFDMTIIDSGLPDIDGIEVARQLRLNSEPPPRLLAITGSSWPGADQHFRDHGFDGFLAKPFSLAALKDAMLGIVDHEVTPPPDDSDGILDETHLMGLYRDLGCDSELMLDLAATFHLQVEDFLKAAGVGRSELVEPMAHRLIGSCSRLGMSTVAESARELERSMSAGEESSTQLRVLMGQLPGSAAAFESWVNQVAAASS